MVMQVFHGDDGDNFQNEPKQPTGRQTLQSGTSRRRWFVDSGSDTNNDQSEECGDQVASPYFLKFVARKSLFEFNAPRPA